MTQIYIWAVERYGNSPGLSPFKLLIILTCPFKHFFATDHDQFLQQFLYSPTEKMAAFINSSFVDICQTCLTNTVLSAGLFFLHAWLINKPTKR